MDVLGSTNRYNTIFFEPYMDFPIHMLVYTQRIKTLIDATDLFFWISCRT